MDHILELLRYVASGVAVLLMVNIVIVALLWNGSRNKERGQ